MTSIDLFYIVNRFQLEKTFGEVPNLNMPMFNSDFKVYKNSFFDIIFNVKNNDRKPIQLIGKKLRFQAVNPESNEVIIMKQMLILDVNAGKIQLTLTPTETIDLSAGYYRYSISVINQDNSDYLLYTDISQSSFGYFIVEDGVLPLPANSFELLWPDSYIGFSQGWQAYTDDVTPYYISKLIPGIQQKGISNRLHTMAIYMNNYSGKIWIQGTLQSAPTQAFEDWFYINLTPFSKEIAFMHGCGIFPINFELESYWLRVILLPNYTIPIPLRGEVTKILVKN